MLLTEALRVPVPAGELHVERAGRGPAVVLLHSGTTDASMWDPQMPALLDGHPEGHTVVRFDARGHGRSSTPAADWRPDDDLLAVLDALDLERVALVGNSYGGATALDLALEHPERVRSLLLCGPGINPMRFEDPFVLAQHRAQADAIAAGDPAAYVEAFLRLAVDGPHRTPAQTPDVLRVVRDAHRRIPGAQRVDLPGTGHMTNLEQPEAFDRLLLDDLARHA